MEHFYEDVVGWFDFADIYTHRVERARDGDVFIEIGTANGKSAAFMCVEIANSGKKIEFVTVDIFPPENEIFHQEENVRKLLEQFEFCTVIKSDSVEFLKTMPEDSIDFIFIDGKHEIDPLIFELMVAHEKVKVGGHVGGHDYWESYPDVKKTVDAFCDFIYKDKEIFNKSFIFRV